MQVQNVSPMTRGFLRDLYSLRNETLAFYSQNDVRGGQVPNHNLSASSYEKACRRRINESTTAGAAQNALEKKELENSSPDFRIARRKPMASCVVDQLLRAM